MVNRQHTRPDIPPDQETATSKAPERAPAAEPGELSDEQLDKVSGGTGVTHETRKALVSNVRG